MKRGPVQHLRPYDYKDMQDQILSSLYRIVFMDAVELIRASDLVLSLRNAQSGALEKALRTGRVQYTQGVFSGEFSAQIAVEIRKLGGRFDKRMKVYFIKPELVPTWVKAASESFRSKAKELHESILRYLDQTQTRLDDIVEAQKIDARKTIDRVEDGFRASADAIRVHPELSTTSKEVLAAEYSENMKLYIRDFADSAIKSLREVVEENAQAGYRAERLAKMIRQRYGVTKNKSEFLARQETSLFMAKYRELRFKEGGVERYTWHTAHDERVRPGHKELDGHIFFYDQKAPASHFDTGTPCNPGEDFNCRCVDSPLVERFEEAREMVAT